MQWEADLLHALQSVSNPFLDWMFGVITFCGDELFFMLVAMFFFWCISKRDGYRFINVYFVGCAAVELCKVAVGRTRPYEKYDGYVRPIGEESAGHSFPSGHSHSISNMSTQVVLKYRKKKLCVFLPIAIAATVLVVFSRLYLGQHYLTDVLVGTALGIGVAILFTFLFELLKNKEEWLAVAVVPLCIIVAIIALTVLDSGDAQEKVLKVAGAYIAVTAGYFVEKRFIKFDVRARRWKQIIKVALGAGVALGLQIGLKYICPAEVSIFVYAFVRYFIIAAWAIVGAPLVFKLLRLYDGDGKQTPKTENLSSQSENA